MGRVIYISVILDKIVSRNKSHKFYGNEIRSIGPNHFIKPYYGAMSGIIIFFILSNSTSDFY